MNYPNRHRPTQCPLSSGTSPIAQHIATGCRPVLLRNFSCRQEMIFSENKKVFSLHWTLRALLANHGKTYTASALPLNGPRTEMKVYRPLANENTKIAENDRARGVLSTFQLGFGPRVDNIPPPCNKVCFIRRRDGFGCRQLQPTVANCTSLLQLYTEAIDLFS